MLLVGVLVDWFPWFRFLPYLHEEYESLSGELLTLVEVLWYHLVLSYEVTELAQIEK